MSAFWRLQRPAAARRRHRSFDRPLLAAVAGLSAALLITRGEIYLQALTALSAGLLLLLLARRFPALPLYLLLALGPGAGHLYNLYGLDVRLGALAVLFTDPVYAVLLLNGALAALLDRRSIPALWWRWLRGGVVLAAVFAVLIGLGAAARGYAALAEFRYLFLGCFVPFYCLCLNFSAAQWWRFLRRSFWLSAAVTLPLVLLAAGHGARPFSPEHRFLMAEMHLWLGVSLLLLSVPGLVRNAPAQSVGAWLVGAAYLLLIISDAHRSVWLVLTGALAVILLLRHDELGRLRAATLLGGALLASALALVLSQQDSVTADFIASRSTAFVDPAQDPNSAWRLQVWEASWRIIRDNLLTGIGLGSYYEAVWQSLTGAARGPSLHNLYLTLLLKGGLPLALAYAWYMLSAARAFAVARRVSEPHIRTVAALGLALLAGMLLWQVPYTASVTLWLFVGVLLALARALHAERDGAGPAHSGGRGAPRVLPVPERPQ